MTAVMNIRGNRMDNEQDVRNKALDEAAKVCEKHAAILDAARIGTQALTCYDMAQSIRALHSAPVPVIAPDNTKVICPECTHQFRAIPVQVQQLMIGHGIEPPFVAPVIAQGEREAFEKWAQSHGGIVLTPVGNNGEANHKMFPATYFYDDAEIAWRAWANKPAAVSQPAPAKAKPSIEIAVKPTGVWIHFMATDGAGAALSLSNIVEERPNNMTTRIMAGTINDLVASLQGKEGQS